MGTMLTIASIRRTARQLHAEGEVIGIESIAEKMGVKRPDVENLINGVLGFRAELEILNDGALGCVRLKLKPEHVGFHALHWLAARLAQRRAEHELAEFTEQAHTGTALLAA